MARAAAVSCLEKNYEAFGCGEGACQSVESINATGQLYNATEQYLLDPRSQEAPYKEFEPFEFRLNDDQLEVRLGIHVARLVLDQFNLAASLATVARRAAKDETHLSPYPLQDPVHQVLRPGQYFGGDAFCYPASCQLLQIARLLRRRINRDFGKEVIDVHYAMRGNVSAE
jgi:hypothetical protein